MSMREDEFLVLIGAKIRWFLLGRVKPLDNYLDDTKSSNTTNNVLVGYSFSILFIFLLLLIVVAIKNFF